MLRDLFNDAPLIAWILIIAIASGIFFLMDSITSNQEIVPGTIHEMTFVHGNQTTTVGMAFTSKGAAPVIATSGHPDEWSVIIKLDDEYLKVKCETTQYYSHEVGDKITLIRSYGKVTGINWSNHLK